LKIIPAHDTMLDNENPVFYNLRAQDKYKWTNPESTQARRTRGRVTGEDEPGMFGEDAIPRPSGAPRKSKSQRSSANSSATSGSSKNRLTEFFQEQIQLDLEAKKESLDRELAARLAIKIWEDRRQSPIAVLRPHDGLPVNSVTFLTAPHRPDHIILITGGPLNREVKIWASDSEEGWLLPSDADSWHCTQTLELKSSAEPRIEDAFFNQVIALPQSGLLLLANARKNAIYAVHLDYGPNPETTRMDYIAEFTVTMPILSFTGISDPLPNGDHIVKVYCVQTQAIQQYALDLSQCLPPPIYDVYEKSGSPVSRDETSAEGFMGLGPTSVKLEPSSDKLEPSSSDVAPISIQRLSSPSAEAETKPVSSLVAKDTDISSVVSPAVPLSPKLSEKIYDFISPSSGSDSRHQLNSYDDQTIMEYPANTRLESSHAPSLDSEENKVAKEDRSVKFMHPTHLVTPAELMATSSCEANDIAVNTDAQNAEVEVKIVGETGISQNGDTAYEVKEQSKSFSSQASALVRDMARDMVNESNQFDGTVESKVVDQTSDARGELGDVVTDLSAPVENAVTGILKSGGSALREKKKKKNAQVSGQSSSPSVSNYTDTCDEIGVSSSISSVEAILTQIQSMQELLAQVILDQKEIQKQIPVVAAVQITKEGKRIEAAIGKSMEKIHKANFDANWARSQEEFAKQEKLNQERHQQVSTSASVAHKDALVATEKMLKKEIAAVVPAVGRAVTPIIEKAISTAVTEAFQRGVGDKAVNQLEKTVNSKLEATVSRQIQTQFQTSGKQALQEALRLSMEASVVPAFEMSCKTMFEQVDATFQKGMVEHTNAAQQKVESTNSPLAFALRDAINSASSMTQTLTSELADGQRKLMALAVAGASSNQANSLISQLSNGPTGGFHEKVEAPVDPTRELSRLLNEHKYEEAFTAALQRSDLRIVSWLCSQVDLQGILASNPLPLTQGVLLSLLQQLACDIGNDTTRKLSWMMDVVVAIKPSDGIIAMHVRPIFEQVHSILNNQVNVPTNSVAERSSLRVVIQLVNSTLRSL
ncbi:hypothetical protein Tco_0015849, partial [Tanacetum coccineum]